MVGSWRGPVGAGRDLEKNRRGWSSLGEAQVRVRVGRDGHYLFLKVRTPAAWRLVL